MTQEEINEGNKLISEFEHGKILPFPLHLAEYHTSFDWLMSVVERIESTYDDFHGYFGVYISSNSCTIQGTNLRTTPDNPHYAYHNEVTLNTKIESTWYAVVQFIKWHNTQQ